MGAHLQMRRGVYVLGVSSKKIKDRVIWSIWAVCPYCKKNYEVELSLGITADTTLIPCFFCWDRYEENPIDVPVELLFASNLSEAKVILKELWLDIDIPEPDFSYFKRFVKDNFR